MRIYVDVLIAYKLVIFLFWLFVTSLGQYKYNILIKSIHGLF